MASNNALILHCWYGNPNLNWYPWLKSELENRNYQVSVPAIPTMDTDLPDMGIQLEFIKENFQVNENTLIIGHSLGAVLALRLAEIYKFKQMILVAGWDFDDLTDQHQKFWPNPINHQLIKNNVNNITYVSSDNDPYVTAFQAEEMSKRLNAKFLLIKNAGHFTKETFGITQIPQILELI